MSDLVDLSIRARRGDAVAQTELWRLTADAVLAMTNPSNPGPDPKAWAAEFYRRMGAQRLAQARRNFECEDIRDMVREAMRTGRTLKDIAAEIITDEQRGVDVKTLRRYICEAETARR